MKVEEKDKKEAKVVVIQPDDITIQIDDLLARKFTIKEEKKEERKNG